MAKINLVPSKKKKTKQKKEETHKRASSVIQEPETSRPPSISLEEANSRACVIVDDIADAMTKATRVILLLGKPKRDHTSIIQTMAMCESLMVTAAEHTKALRERIAANPDLTTG